ncbi:family 43 glycosylhydrolase [Salinimicrobium sp. CDJ15-81-2]|nr:family 43 glycosylhydrolase [Salinimicrobium nanhaiense]
MKHFTFPLLVFISMITFSCTEQGKKEEPIQEEQELQLKDITLADPTIFYHEGTYYLYGTSQGNLSEMGNGFLVYTSKDLQVFSGPAGATDGFALKQGQAFGTKGFWAPQVLEYNDRFYMAYTANEHIAIASSDSPLGPFTNPQKTALEAPVKQIDPFIFFDEDGKIYLYHVRLTEGNRIFVAEMEEGLMAIKPETLTEVIAAQEPWEDTQDVPWPVAEGPTVLKKGGLYYLVYSANDFRNPDYAVGYATSNHPLGPWKKSGDSPIIHGDMVDQYGSGHGDVLIDQKGNMHYILHTHFSSQEVHPRKTAVVKLDFTEAGTLEADAASFRFLKEQIKN